MCSYQGRSICRQMLVSVCFSPLMFAQYKAKEPLNLEVYWIKFVISMQEQEVGSDFYEDIE